jgi:hypothetical protein
VWTDAIQGFVKRQSDPLIPRELHDAWEAECLIVYSEGYFTFGPVTHEFASHNWKNGGYISWQDARKALTAEVAAARNTAPIPASL